MTSTTGFYRTNEANRGTYRSALAIASLTALFMFYVNGAVGIVDTDADWLYLGVIGVGILGAFLTRLQPRGMVRTLGVVLGAQTLVILIALLTGAQDSPTNSVREILLLNGFFMVFWIIAAVLFKRAAEKQELTR